MLKVNIISEKLLLQMLFFFQAKDKIARLTVFISPDLFQAEEAIWNKKMVVIISQF
jgi:hypothetical protein